VAFHQPDIKKLVAYSSVSHLGFVVLGIFMFVSPDGRTTPNGITGGILQMVNHGLSTGMLFLLVGIIYERRHTRELANYGGIAKVVPLYSVFFLIATLSSIGLPGLNGFVGEFLILLGTFEVNPLYAVIASTGVILGAVYMLTLVKRFLFGPLVHAENAAISDVSPREIAYLAPIVAMMVWIGLYPAPFINLVEPTVVQYLDQLK
jgi:NADH-quinone oxidoreductase subunit M